MTLSSRKRNQRRLEAARGYLVLGMPEHALRELDRVEIQRSVRFDTLLLQGEAYRDCRRHDQAVGAYLEALAERPENLQTLLGLAWCYKRLDRLADAITTLEEARRLHPDEPIVIYNLACYFSLARDKPRAIENLGRALRMEPDLRTLIADETDFDPLRNDPDFQFVAGQASGVE